MTTKKNSRTSHVRSDKPNTPAKIIATPPAARRAIPARTAPCNRPASAAGLAAHRHSYCRGDRHPYHGDTWRAGEGALPGEPEDEAHRIAARLPPVHRR